MPAHNHPAALNASSNPTSDSSPAGNFLADGNSYTNTTNAQMNAGAVTIGIAGNNQPVSILQPYLAINFIIALEGIFPSRN
jgi:microcystin-dependent protein